MKRYTMGIFGGVPAMFEQLDGGYVRWRDVASLLTICGQSDTPIDPDLVGCGQPILRVDEVYRCTDCGVPFHKDCAKKHFETDTPEHSAKVYEEQIRRLDKNDVLAEIDKMGGGV
ncbi:MAG TPA: hypothetical protein VN039_02620 [Nitrospira sp.]|nr:hypothetical protein [Nitrospira sp.]